MVGIPASGKSTYLDKYRDKNIVISRDKIRLSLLKEGDDYFSNEKEVFNEFVKQIQEALDTVPQGIDVYADATHINYLSRRKLLSRLRLKNVDVKCIYIKTPIEVALERNKKREGLERTPDNVILNFGLLLEPPTLEEYNYKLIITINNAD